MSFHRTRIKYPDRLLDPWLQTSDPSYTLKLYRQKKLPPAIAGFMIVTSIKYALRAVYGSDLKAAFILLLEALTDLVARRTLSSRILLWCAVRGFMRDEDDYWGSKGVPRDDKLFEFKEYIGDV